MRSKLAKEIGRWAKIGDRWEWRKEVVSAKVFTAPRDGLLSEYTRWQRRDGFWVFDAEARLKLFSISEERGSVEEVLDLVFFGCKSRLIFLVFAQLSPFLLSAKSRIIMKLKHHYGKRSMRFASGLFLCLRPNVTGVWGWQGMGLFYALQGLAKSVEGDGNGDAFFGGLKDREHGGFAILKFAFQDIRHHGLGKTANLATAQKRHAPDILAINNQAKSRRQARPLAGPPPAAFVSCRQWIFERSPSARHLGGLRL